MAVLFLIVAGSALAAAQNIIPGDRLTNWTPGATVGVPGGISNHATVGSAVGAATYGTGSVDASEAIGAAKELRERG